MQSEFWLEKWQHNQIGFHLDDFNSNLVRYWPLLSNSRKGAVFVPLCGKSKDLFWLQQQGHAVIGIELSELAVAAFFAEHKLKPVVTERGSLLKWQAENITIYQGDFFALQATDVSACQLIYDRAALVALPPEMRQRYAQHLNRLFPVALPTLLITLEYPDEEMQGPPFSINPQEVTEHFDRLFNIQELQRQSVLQEYPNFMQQGLSALQETVFALAPINKSEP